MIVELLDSPIGFGVLVSKWLSTGSDQLSKTNTDKSTITEESVECVSLGGSNTDLSQRASDFIEDSSLGGRAS